MEGPSFHFIAPRMTPGHPSNRPDNLLSVSVAVGVPLSDTQSFAFLPSDATQKGESLKVVKDGFYGSWLRLGQ